MSFFWSLSFAENFYTLPEIVVKDSAIQDKSAFSKTVVKVEQGKTEEKTLSEILENQPGIHVTTLAGRGSYSVVSIRGSTSSQVLVYIDGVLVNSGGNSSVDFSNIPVEQIEKIVIYRGNVPGKFGRGGIGGVISITTRKNLKYNGNISATIGSWKFYKTEGNLKYKKFFANASLEARTGDYPYLNDANTPFNSKDDYHAHRQNNYYNNKNLLFNYKIPIKEGILSTTYRHFYKYRNLPGAAPGRDKSGALTDAVLITKNHHIDTAYSFMLDKGVVSLQPFYDIEKKGFYNPKYKLGMYGLLKSKYSSNRYGGNISYEINLNDYINLGVFGESRVETLKTYFIPQSTWIKNGSYKRVEYAFTFQNDFKFLDKSLFVSPVFRKNKIKDTDRRANVSDSFSKNTCSIGIKYIPVFMKNFYLKFNYGKFVRFPNFYEKFGDGATVIPNSDLDYEKSENFDYGFGFKYKFFTFDLTVFKNRVKNLIEFVMVNERYSMYKNIESADINGVEVNAGINLYNVIIVTANYTKLKTKSKQSGYKLGSPLPNRPAHKTYVRVQSNLKKFTFWIEYNETGKNYFDDGGNYYYNTFCTANAGVVYKRVKKWTFSLTVKNLTNNQDMYSYANGFNVAKLPYYPVEGRHFYFKMNYNF